MADAFTLAVIQAALDAAATEMFDVLRKTAMSPIIYEVLDVGTGILDADGELISSGAGIPSFVGVLDKSVKSIRAAALDIRDGDVFVVNDPNYGGVTHLNDVVVAEPVFCDGTCIAWAASIAHWGDVGGRVAGSMSTDVQELVAEGLRLPAIKLVSAGALNNAVMDIIRCNSRLPEFVTGDLHAQLSAGHRAKRSLIELASRFGVPTLNAAIADARELAEAKARAGMASLPQGTVTCTAEQDDGSIWRATIDVTSDQFVVDLRGAPAQTVGPYNTSRDGAVIACQMLFKALTNPERSANAGSFAPLSVLTQPGTIFHADETAPHGFYFETRIRLFDMLWKGLARIVPEKLPAGHFATIFGTVLAGQHADTGRPYVMVEPQMGGWGATDQRPGTGPLFSTSHGDTFNCPVEVSEARYGLEVVLKQLNLKNDQERHAGGPGVLTKYRMRAPALLSVGFSHASVPVWDQDSGHAGNVNALTVQSADGNRQPHQLVGGLQLSVGDVVEISTARGGSAVPSGQKSS